MAKEIEKTKEVQGFISYDATGAIKSGLIGNSEDAFLEALANELYKTAKNFEFAGHKILKANITIK